jgi:hypothetical protein
MIALFLLSHFLTSGYSPIDSFQEKEISSFEALLLRQKALKREELQDNEPHGEDF